MNFAYIDDVWGTAPNLNSRQRDRAMASTQPGRISLDTNPTPTLPRPHLVPIPKQTKPKEDILSVIQKLPTSQKLIVFADTNDEECIICAVCTDPIGVNQDVIKLPCNHEYHSVCIKTWLLLNPQCPLCKGNVIKDAKRIQQKLNEEEEKKKDKYVGKSTVYNQINEGKVGGDISLKKVKKISKDKK